MLAGAGAAARPQGAPPLWSPTRTEQEIEGRLLAPPTAFAPTIGFETPVSAVAERLRAGGEPGCDFVVGLAPDVQSAATCIVLARALAATARVALVDLAFAAPRLDAISSNPQAPGMADLVQGRASFAAVMTRDRGSRAIVVGVGRAQESAADILASPRLKLALEALARTSDNVIVDGGTLGDIPLERLQALARRVILAVPAGAEAEAAEMIALLQEAGFVPSAVLTAPSRRAQDGEAPVTAEAA
jgi:hypothetical protein